MTSHEAKMPEMPEMPEAIIAACWLADRRSEIEKAVQTYGRACYLAGLEAARQAVPERKDADWNDEITHRRHEGHNICRETTLSNLTALVKEAQK